ncbi:Arabinogalactan protein 16 [Ranunculus cassubicifolius]
MAVSRVSFRVMVMAVLVFSIVLPQAHAQAPAPAPTSDGTSIDQGIAYVLMLVALVLTYLIHPLDASSYHSFF